MTLPVSGSLSFNQIRSELGLGGALSLNDTAVRALAGKPSGIISVSDLFGKSALPHVSNPFYVGQDNFETRTTGTIQGDAVMAVPVSPPGLPGGVTIALYQDAYYVRMNVGWELGGGGDYTSVLSNIFNKAVIGTYVMNRVDNWQWDSKYAINYASFLPLIPLSDAQLLALGTVNVEFGN